jgi:hypothetical protein
MFSLDEDDDEDRIEYSWYVKNRIYEEVEGLWQTYMNDFLNYPSYSFRKHIMKYSKTHCGNESAAYYLICQWRFIKYRIFQ